MIKAKIPSIMKIPHIVIPIVLVFCVGYKNCDTIHFTNSPSYLLTKKNFSTYKLDVPGSEPITIFEENNKKFSKRTNNQQQRHPQPPDDEDTFHMGNINDDLDNYDKYSKFAPTLHSKYNENDDKHLITRFANIERLHNNQKNFNIKTSLGMTIVGTENTSIQPSLPAFSLNKDSDTQNEVNTSKTTVYSPVLLDKFLKDYADKLQNADTFTKEKLYEIAKITENKNLNSHLMDRNDDTNGEKNSQQKKSYAPQQQTRPHSGTNSGWVTLDAVPWSSSKISKWQSNKPSSYPPHRPYNDDNDYYRPERPDRPGPERPDRPYNRPSYIDEEPDYVSNSDSYNRPNQQQHGGGYNSFPKPDYEPVRPIYDRPKPIETEYQYLHRPTNNYQPPTNSYGPASSSSNNNYGSSNGPSWYDDDRKIVNSGNNGYGASNQHHQRPWQDELVIDDGPSNFPKYPPKRSDFYAEKQQPLPSPYPSSHPSNGNGEWVLISTTKGYQYPKRHGQRAMSFLPANILAHKSVKLTVLSSNKTDKYGNPQINTSHNGMLEVDSSTQTMEEAVHSSHNNNKFGGNKNGIQYPVKSVKAKKKPLKKLSFTSKSNTQDSGAVLAAIGAGMVPATMALIAPMVLGKKRRKRTAMPNAVLNVTFVPYTDYESSIQKNILI